METLLQLSTNEHHLTVNSRDTVLVGDSITQGWMELGTDFNWTSYLDMLSAKGCNLVMVWSYIGIIDQSDDQRIGYDAPVLWPWKQDHGKFCLETPNDSYFNQLSRFVRYAKRKGIVVIITIHDGWTKTRFTGHPFNATHGGPICQHEQYISLYDYTSEMPSHIDRSWNWKQQNQYYQERYCQWIISATSKYGNVIYEIFNEGEWYDLEIMLQYQTHFLDFFRRRTKCPLMVNDMPKLGQNRDCTLYSSHNPVWNASTNASDAFNFYINLRKVIPHKPLVFSEPVPAYQGDTKMNTALMRLMWGTVLAGTSFVIQNDCSYAFAPRSRMRNTIEQCNWAISIEGICARFTKQLDWSTMQPEVNKSSENICIASTGQECVIYTQNPRISVDLSDFTHGFIYRYLNPSTGEYTKWVKQNASSMMSFSHHIKGDVLMQIRKR